MDKWEPLKSVSDDFKALKRREKENRLNSVKCQIGFAPPQVERAIEQDYWDQFE